MPKDMSNVDLEEATITARQQNLVLWHDYFDLLLEGLTNENGSKDSPWTNGEMEIVVWLRVMKNECASDATHLQVGQDEYCKLGEPKDLRRIDSNIVV